MMKRTINIVVLGLLLSPAIFFAVFAKWTAFLWLGVIYLLGSEAALSIIMLIVFVISLVVAGAYIRLDILGRTSRTSRMIRYAYSLLVLFLMLVYAVRAEVGRVKGWSSQDAALQVASTLYPELKASLSLRLESEEDVPSWRIGPNITYTVLSGREPVCRVAVCRKYWSYWTCGMYETLKDRKPNQKLERTGDPGTAHRSAQP